MKKVFFAISVLATLASCGGSTSQTETPTTDSTSVVTDSTKCCGDSTKVDSTIVDTVKEVK
jgi:hypothetical protein